MPLLRQFPNLLKFQEKKTVARGFSLTEILFALVLIGLLLVILIQILITGHYTIRQGQEIIIATGIAQEILERSRQLGYLRSPVNETYDGQAGTPRSSLFPDFPPDPYPSVEINGIIYFITTNISETAGTSGKVRTLEVIVTWNTKSVFEYQSGTIIRMDRRLRMTTLISETY